MSLSTESLSYLISGMGATPEGLELIAAIQNESVLSAKAMTRLKTCLSEDDIADHLQACILGSYCLSLRDQAFVRDGFELPDSAMQSVLDNLAGGYQSGPPLLNSPVKNVTMPTGFSFTLNYTGKARQLFEAMTFPAGSAFSSSGAGQYFKLFTAGNAHKYYVWYNVLGGSNTDPAPAGFTGIVVDITAAYTAAQVATATQSALATGTPAVAAFAILANSAITNTGASVITGDVGITPGTSITDGGWTLIGTEHVADAAAATGQAAAQASFTAKQTLGLAGSTIASELGGQTITPGAYKFASGSAGLSLTSGHSTLTFNGAGTYIIYTASTLLTGASGSTDVPTMAFTGGATSNNTNIYWIVGSSATINQSVTSATATFYGTVIAETSITVTSGGTVQGSLTALTGAVTISAATAVTATSGGSPGSSAMAGANAYVSGSTVTVVVQNAFHC